MIKLFILVLTSPVLQYLLIKSNSRRLIYGGIPFALCFFAPLYYQSKVSFYMATYCCFLMFNFLRILDIALLPPDQVRSWTILQYFEYFFGYYTKAQRKEMGDRCSSKYAIHYYKRNAEYYGRLTWHLFVQYLVVSALVWYSKSFPPGHELPVNTFLRPFEFKRMVDNLAFGLTLCLILNIST